MALAAATKSLQLIGECVPCVKQNASKFKIKRLELDQHLLMYFRKDDYIFAHDPEKKCKTGDIVLIEKLPEKLSRLITHKVKEIVYPLGDVTDPFTGKNVVAGKFRDQIDKVNQAYGKLPTGFDYTKAPKRGWQEDKKDFSHVETYAKYHEDGKDQPYSV
ncbi:PREDICTED: 28S ribosomal protein S17, mitochondrial [Nicrophorus vespilloides]|uniref:28S ribosomal protein S17, mitochondrial n=1 Tax=Nicrophorus vespilloides TaxID=110193 RepID=A0ABM1NB30_NICVS|nr:PREDICTED: 28S ribosomal protein S17, mitochondrial [Nicrophorus vespilloides]